MRNVPVPAGVVLAPFKWAVMTAAPKGIPVKSKLALCFASLALAGSAFGAFPTALTVNAQGGQNNFSFVMEGTKLSAGQDTAVYNVVWYVKNQKRSCQLKLTWEYPADMSIELRACRKGSESVPGVRYGSARFDGAKYRGTYTADGLYSIEF